MGWLGGKGATLLLDCAIVLLWLVCKLLLFLFSPLAPPPGPPPRPSRPPVPRPRGEDPELGLRLEALAVETTGLLQTLVTLRSEAEEVCLPLELEQEVSEDEASEEEGPPSIVNMTSERMRRYNTTIFHWAWVNHPELYGVNRRQQSGLQRRRLSSLPRPASLSSLRECDLPATDWIRHHGHPDFRPPPGLPEPLAPARRQCRHAAWLRVELARARKVTARQPQ